MAFREVTVIQVREALRRWLQGAGERPIAQAAGISRGTARRYITTAQTLGVDRAGGEEQLSDELIGQVCELVRPRRPDRHGDSWHALVAYEDEIKEWVKKGLTAVKIGVLLRRRGVEVPERTVSRFCLERCGAGRRARTRCGRRPAGGHRVPSRLRAPGPGPRRDGQDAGLPGSRVHGLLEPAHVRLVHVLPDNRSGDRGL